MVQPRSGNRQRKLLLLLLSIVVALGLAEVGSRLLGPAPFWAPPRRLPDDVWRELLHRPSAVDGLAYELAPDVRKTWRGTPIETNRFGMRDDHVELQKPPGVVRIAVLGDSYTFGLGVPAEATYPNVLERLLNARSAESGRRFEVLNFGVGGYSTRDEVQVLRHKVPAWQPDLVVVGYVFNDPETEPFQPLVSYFHAPSWWQYSHMLRRVAKIRFDRDVRRLGGGDYFRYLHVHPGKWSSVVEALEEMGQLGRGTGVEILLVIFPAIPLEPWSDYAFADMHDQVAAAADNAGLEVLDLLDSYSRYPSRGLRVSRNDRHPNLGAHELTARVLLERLLLDHPELFD